MANPKAPINIYAIPRENYNIIWWDKVIQDTDNLPITVVGYRIYRGEYINEADQALLFTVDTQDASGNIDSIFIDTVPSSVLTYRVMAIAMSGPTVLESELSDKAVAMKAPSQIDNKTELIDRKLFLLDEGVLDEGLLV